MCFFKVTATPESYTYCHTLSLHDALPISACRRHGGTAGSGDGGDLVAETLHDAFQIHGDDRLVLDDEHVGCGLAIDLGDRARQEAGDLLLVRDRKSTRLNSSH